MNTIELREKISRDLQNIPHYRRAIFASRCAMRVLPLLAKNKQKGDFLGYWNTRDRERYLYNSLTNLKFSYSPFLMSPSKVLTYDSNLAHVKLDSYVNNGFNHYPIYKFVYGDLDFDFEDSTYFNVCLSNTHAAGAATTENTNMVYEREAAVHAHEAILTSAWFFGLGGIYTLAFDIEVLNDLVFIDSIIDESAIYSPLWNEGIPKNWQKYYSNFKEAALNLDKNFIVHFNWLDDRIKGKPMTDEDKELLARQLLLPKEIRNLSIKEINAYLLKLPNKKKYQI